MMSSRNPKGNPETLVKAAQAKKEDAAKRLEAAIQKVLDSGETITFRAVAETAGLSVSYLYKYPEIKNRIADLRNQQKAATGGLVNKIPKIQPATDKSKSVLISKLRQENRRLRGENEGLKKHLEVVQGRLVELRHIEQENARLKLRIQEFEQSLTDTKVTPISKAKSSGVTDQIKSELDSLGIKLNSTLTKKIKASNSETVLAAIEALKDQLNRGEINNPGGWLAKAITEGWVKAETISQKQSVSQPEIFPASTKPDKELVSLDQLKALSNIFEKKDD